MHAKVDPDRLDSAIAPPHPRENQSLVAALANRMTDGVVLLNAEGRINFANQSFAQLLGVEAASLRDSGVRDWLDDVGRHEFDTCWPRRRQGNSDPYVLTWRHADGHSVATSVLPSPLFDDRGRFLGSLAILLDTKERQRVASELASAQVILASSTMVLYRARLEPDFPIEYVSSNVVRFGYEPDDLTSGRVSLQDVIHEDDFDRVINDLGQKVGRGEAQFTQCYRVRRKDGEVLWVEDHAYVRQRPHGLDYVIEGALNDVTERHVAEEARRSALTQTIRALVATIDRRDPYTAGHQRRVANLSLAIAREMRVEPNRCDGLYLGALIHDLGKLAIPSEILAKPGRLSEEELALIRTHVRAGVEMLQGVTFPWPIAAMIEQHHERLDGSGYPRGSCGDTIMLEARIIAVSDVFEAMSGHRPYRAALGIDRALAELERHRSIQFDDDVVEVCCAVVHSCAAPSADILWQKLEASASTGTAM